MSDRGRADAGFRCRQEFRVGAGPYTVPISITGASQISSVSLTVTYNPAVLRLRVAQEGPFLRAGGVQARSRSSRDAAAGRLDIAIVRPGDTTGVAGTGLLAALLFETVAPGPANLTVNGSASGSRRYAGVTAVRAGSDSDGEMKRTESAASRSSSW